MLIGKPFLQFVCVIAAGLAACSCSDRRGTIDVTPENSLSWLSVYQISLEDSATVVKGSLYGFEGDTVRIPADVHLRGDASGTEYRLLHAPETPDEKTAVIPADMTMPFTLVFEPLDDSETSFDLVCGSESVRGIKTAPEKSEYTTTIYGTLVDRPSTTRLVLLPANADFRVSPYISIPVKDGRFSYRLHTDQASAYDLICWDEIMNGSWYSTVVFSDGGKVGIRIFPEDQDKMPEVTEATSRLNREYLEYREETKARFMEDELQAEADSLYENRLFHTREYMDLLDSAENAGYPEQLMERIYALNRSDDVLTDAAKRLKARMDSIRTEKKKYIAEYCSRNTDIVGYYILFDRFFWERDSTYHALYKDIFQTSYMDAYPDHPFTMGMIDKIAAEEIRPGGHFIDFTAPDLQGRQHTLSEEIAGKIAVIDLWASWCGPCRKHSMELIPVYDKYKDSGFTVVGIAREQGNTDAMSAAVAKDGYPWLNLVDLNDAGRIWYRYGVGNAGGMTVLVDPYGTIVMVNPDVEQVEKYLEEKITLYLRKN